MTGVRGTTEAAGQELSAHARFREKALTLFEFMVLSREIDIREDRTVRQGKAPFFVPSAGHEAMAALTFSLKPEDVLFLHYRDRALALARGLSVRDMALSFFSKDSAADGGRQMPSHFSSRKWSSVKNGWDG